MDRSEVDKISKLARIKLEDSEAEHLKDQFTRIIEFIKKLDELDLKDTEPLSHPLDVKNAFREDKPSPSMGSENLMKLAPNHSKDMIRVPKVIEK